VITARMLPSRQTGDLIDGHWRLLADGWGAVPKMLVWDNEAGVGKGRLTSEFAAFAGLLAVKVHLCRPRDPEAKGLVERANGYLETSFLPGRTFTGPDDFNTQLTAWLQIANRRQHRSIGARPADRWEADRAAMLTVPPVSPPSWWRFHTRIGRDHYIRVDTNDYSVHPRAIGRTVTVRADNEAVTVIAGDDLVARHARCWARHQSITDPEHAAAAQAMRGEVIRRQAARAATARTAAILAPDSLGIEVEQRELGTYDRMFTLIEGGAGKEDT
jgi:transposase